MDELTQQVSSRTGISDDQSREAIDTVVGYLKQRLPEPAAMAVDQALGGGQSGGAFGQATDAAKNIFNR